MATFQEFAQQLLNLRGTLRSFYRKEIATGRRAIPLDWLRRYKASLGVMENILNDLKNLAPDLSDASEIIKRIKYWLEKLEEHLNALTASPAGRGLVVDISPLKGMADELERKISGAGSQQQVEAARPQKVIQPPAESEFPKLFAQLFSELGNIGENLKQAFQTKVESQREIPKDWLEQVKGLINESYDILNDIFANLSEALREVGSRNYHAASQAMGRVNARLENLKEHWVNLKNLGLNLGTISPAINLAWRLTGGINSVITRQRRAAGQGAALRKYLILKFIFERL
jgi:hypothetical protein